jgi:hypothetical protein
MATAGRLRLITDAAVEPLSLADAKAFAQIDSSADDTMLTALITAARRYVEKRTGLALINQTWVAVLDRWPGRNGRGFSEPWWDGVREGPISLIHPVEPIEVVKRPFQSVTQIQLRDDLGAYTTVDSSLYFVERSGYTARIVRKADATWPSVTLSQTGAIEITFVAGFGSAASDVPDDLVTGLKMLVKHWYDHRDLSCDGAGGSVPFHIGSIFNSWAERRLR